MLGWSDFIDLTEDFCWFTLLYNEGTDLFHFIPGLPTSVKSILQFPPDDWWPLTGRTAQISSIVNLMALTTWDIKKEVTSIKIYLRKKIFLGKISSGFITCLTFVPLGWNSVWIPVKKLDLKSYDLLWRIYTFLPVADERKILFSFYS